MHFKSDVVNKANSAPQLKPDAVPTIFPNLPSYLSSVAIPTRTNPDDRRQNVERDHKRKIDEYFNADLVGSYDSFCANHPNKISRICDWESKTVSGKTWLYMCDFGASENIQIVCSVSVDINLQVSVFLKESELTYNDLKWVLEPDMKLRRWSEFENILARYKYQSSCDNNVSDNLEKSLRALEITKMSSDIDMFEYKSLLDLIIDQVKLISSKRKRYSSATVIAAFVVYTQSSSTYALLRNIFVFPHPRYLQYLSSKLSISADSTADNQNYFGFMCKELTDMQRKLIIQIDEIYLNASLQYKSQSVVGYAENNPEAVAKTVQAFMVSSVFGNFREIVRLFPSSGLNGNDLSELTKNVVDFVQSFNCQVIAIITDNNRINQNLFYHLTESKQSLRYQNPIHAEQDIFLLYDFVHIFKNVRNNWLNLKNYELTFIYPDFNDNSIHKKASFNVLRTQYKAEVNLQIRQAYKLCHKSLYPGNLDRQKVYLVDNIFHDSTISALQCQDDFKETADFLEIIRKWWSIVNVKSNTKGIRKRNEWCDPIFAANDKKVLFLKSFLEWLENWQKIGIAGLTSDTHKAIHRSTQCIVEIIEKSFAEFNIKYFLTGKFQTDNLEERFGKYRLLAGTSYHVTYTEVLESEKKLRLRKLFKLQQHDDQFSIAELKELSKVDVNDADTGETIDCSEFLPIFETDYLASVESDNSANIYVAGYAAHSVSKKIKCTLCKQVVVKEKGAAINDPYFDYLQRGGLSVPEDQIMYILYHMISLFQYIVRDSVYKTLFLKKVNNKQVLINLTFLSISNEICDIDLSKICECGLSNEKIYKKIGSPLANVVINNFIKNQNSEMCALKAQNKRKLDKFVKAQVPKKRNVASN